MSTVTDDDTELRDLVSYTLENSGILGKIKAQLRANVYLALEELMTLLSLFITLTNLNSAFRIDSG